MPLRQRSPDTSIDTGRGQRQMSPRLVADRAEAGRLAPLRAKIGDWQTRAAHLYALAVAAHAASRSESARREALALCRTVTKAIAELDEMGTIDNASGSRTADVRKSLAALADALRRI